MLLLSIGRATIPTRICQDQHKTRAIFIIIPPQQDVPYKIHYLSRILTRVTKKQITLNLPKNVICLGPVPARLARLERTNAGHSFIPAYSSITIEANSTNGFLTIFQMIKELNKEPVICINGLWLQTQLSMPGTRFAICYLEPPVAAY